MKPSEPELKKQDGKILKMKGGPCKFCRSSNNTGRRKKNKNKDGRLKKKKREREEKMGGIC